MSPNSHSDLSSDTEYRRKRDEGLQEQGRLRPPGESSDPPSRGVTVLTKATTKTYPELIRRDGWVIVAYCRDDHWCLNALYDGGVDYVSLKPSYNLAASALTAVRKLIRGSDGRLSGVLVDTSRCSVDFNGEGLFFSPTIRLYRDGKCVADLELRSSFRGEGSAGDRVRAWVESRMEKE